MTEITLFKRFMKTLRNCTRFVSSVALGIWVSGCTCWVCVMKILSRSFHNFAPPLTNSFRTRWRRSFCVVSTGGASNLKVPIIDRTGLKIRALLRKYGVSFAQSSSFPIIPLCSVRENIKICNHINYHSNGYLTIAFAYSSSLNSAAAALDNALPVSS